MSLYVWVDPHFALTPWYRDLYSGLKHALSARRMKLEPEILSRPRKLDEEPAMVVLVGETLFWYDSMIAALSKSNIHICIAGCGIDSVAVSTISSDHKRDMFNLVRFMLECERNRIALFGFNPSSPHDKQRLEGFHHAASVYNLPKICQSDIYLTDGAVSNCAQRLLQEIDSYNAMIVGNDLYGAYILSRLHQIGKRIPEDIAIVSFGELCLGSLSRPPLSSMTVDLYKIGEMVVSAYSMWLKSPEITQFTILVESTFYARASMHNGSFDKSKYPYKIIDSGISSYADENLMELVQLENFLSHTDDVDYAIVNALIEDIPFDALAEKLFMSDSALDYRINKMYKHFSVNGRQALAGLFTRFNGFISFPSCAKPLNYKNGL